MDFEISLFIWLSILSPICWLISVYVLQKDKNQFSFYILNVQLIVFYGFMNFALKTFIKDDHLNKLQTILCFLKCLIIHSFLQLIFALCMRHHHIKKTKNAN